MPEGPELRMAALLVSAHGRSTRFGGAITRSDAAIKKFPKGGIPFKADEYKIWAESRGKEMKVFLEDGSNPSNRSHVLFRFGMSGCFKLSPSSDLPKHAHVRFHSLDGESVLAFVDYRRFGKWEVEADWGEDRGPDAMDEPEDFRRNIMTNLEDKAFNRPICEAMLNQKFFNGVGNYLRAEILYRCSVRPFDQARAVLQDLPIKRDPDTKTEDLIDLCGSVMKEVVNLGRGKGYDVVKDAEAEAQFAAWTRCYSKAGMDNLVDANGRAIWFSGEPGTMAPKVKKSRARVGAKKEAEAKKRSAAEVKKEEEEVKEEDDGIPLKKVRQCTKGKKRG